MLSRAKLNFLVSLKNWILVQTFSSIKVRRCSFETLFLSSYRRSDEENLPRVGALVQWLKEETHILKVVGSSAYRSTVYWTYIFC